MIRRLALTAGFAIFGAVAFAPNAQAQTAESEPIMFDGTVGAVCTFSDTKPGTLALLDDATLSTLTAGGVSGQTTVICTSDDNDITVAVPRQLSAPTNFQGSSVATVSYNGDLTDSDNAGPFPVPAGEATLVVDMAVESADGGPLPDGFYEYEVTVTATSN